MVPKASARRPEFGLVLKSSDTHDTAPKAWSEIVKPKIETTSPAKVQANVPEPCTQKGLVSEEERWEWGGHF
jgi:hypothetical protein